LKSYVCSLGKGSRPAFQIEFDRLSEVGAGGIVEDSISSELKSVYGSFRVAKNDVFLEAKKIFDAYGVREVTDNCIKLKLTTGSPAQDYQRPAPENLGACESNKSVMWYLTYPQSENHTQKGFPDSWQLRVVMNKWPPNWNFYYTACAEKTPLVDCVMLWRPMTQSDLVNYEKQIRVYEAKIGAIYPVAGREADATGHPDPTGPIADRYFLLVDHIAHGNLPDDFLTIVDGDPAHCGCGEGLEKTGIHVRQLLLETAFVRNISNSALALDGFFGEPDGSTALRPFQAGSATAPGQALSIGAATLQPGETLAIPMRINFVPADSLANAFEEPSEADKTYRRIRATPPGTLLKTQDCEKNIGVRSDSFGPPSAPSPKLYSYGPALTLKGVSIAGARVDFDNSASNFFRIAAGDSVGSCPYVYSWDRDEKDWVRHGKIIDRANAREKETTERISIKGLATRFQIREEEFELTFVHKVRLELELNDGRSLTLKPVNRLRRESARHYDRLKYNSLREYAFNAPVGQNEGVVVKSTLVVSGYYLRYSNMALVK
jgi:hypothetical protein